MDKLKQNWDDLNNDMADLEGQIAKEKLEAEKNIEPLKEELSQAK